MVRHGRTDTPTSIVKRSVIRDARLSFGARGLYLLLHTLPEDWSCNFRHLLAMGPGGKTKFQGLVDELKTVGAVSIKEFRLSHADADAKNRAEADTVEKIAKKQYRAGQLHGHEWTVHHPDDWAREFSLDPKQHDHNLIANFQAEVSLRKHKSRKTENPLSAKPAVGKSLNKRVLKDGLSINNREEQVSTEDVSNFISGLGLLVVNDEDKKTIVKMYQQFSKRRDLMLEAIAIVRAQKVKNRPYPTTIFKVARGLLRSEEYNDLLVKPPGENL